MNVNELLTLGETYGPLVTYLAAFLVVVGILGRMVSWLWRPMVRRVQGRIAWRRRLALIEEWAKLARSVNDLQRRD